MRFILFVQKLLDEGVTILEKLPGWALRTALVLLALRAIYELLKSGGLV